MNVKICGLKTMADSMAAADLGADMLGFNFYPPSPRSISPESCRVITADLRTRFPDIQLVGVFVNANCEDIAAILDYCNLDLAQLSGDEPPAVLIKLGPRAFKAIRPTSPTALHLATGLFPRRTSSPALLIDTYRKGEFGGTGLTADWSLAHQAASKMDILLAGGLTPENLLTAIEQVKPWGVDVASGVESSPGVKEISKMEQFIRLARRANHNGASA